MASNATSPPLNPNSEVETRGSSEFRGAHASGVWFSASRRKPRRAALATAVQNLRRPRRSWEKARQGTVQRAAKHREAFFWRLPRSWQCHLPTSSRSAKISLTQRTPRLTRSSCRESLSSATLGAALSVLGVESGGLPLWWRLRCAMPRRLRPFVNQPERQGSFNCSFGFSVWLEFAVANRTRCFGRVPSSSPIRGCHSERGTDYRAAT